MRKIILSRPKEPKVIYLDDFDFKIRTTLIVTKSVDGPHLLVQVPHGGWHFIDIGTNCVYYGMPCKDPKEYLRDYMLSNPNDELFALGSPSELGAWLVKNYGKEKSF